MNNENNIKQPDSAPEDQNPIQDNPNQGLENKISDLEESNKNLNDKILRLAAELDNVRKRNREELEKTSKYAISNFANDLVLVVEHFYLADENLPKEEIEKSPTVKHFVDAMLMTKKELTKILEKNGIKRLYPLGEKFDHNFHEAITQVPAEGDEEGGIVKQVIQAGYSIGDRLIKPALVTVITKS